MRPHSTLFPEDTFFDKENSSNTSNRAAFPFRSHGSPLQKRASPVLAPLSQTYKTKRRKTSSSPSLRSDAFQPQSSSLYCKETIPDSETNWLDEISPPRPLEMTPATVAVGEHSKSSPDAWVPMLMNLFGPDHISPPSQGNTPGSRLSDGDASGIPFDLGDLGGFDHVSSSLPGDLPDGMPFFFDGYNSTNGHDSLLCDQVPSEESLLPPPSLETCALHHSSDDSPLAPTLQASLQSEWGQFDLSPLSSMDSLAPSAPPSTHGRLGEVPILPVGSSLAMIAPAPCPSPDSSRLPAGIARPPNRTVDDSCEIIRISWMTNSKTGWQSIRPFPRAISRAKKFVLDPIRINHGGMKLTITVSDNLSLALASGDESSAIVSLPPTDLPVSYNDTLPLVESGQAIEVNCRYERPVVKNKRPLDWVKFYDQNNRLLLEWSCEVFNPKWETMTKSVDKPILENTCSFAWLCEEEWKIVTGKLPGKIST